MADNGRRGIVSLLALIIMTAVTATAVAVAALIIDELQQTESYDQAVTALYAAESGLEQGLFLVKDRRNMNETLETVRGELTASSADPRWDRTSDLEDEFFVSTLPSETTAHVDFVDPVPTIADCGGVAGSCVQSLDITFSDRCTGYTSEHGFSSLEITMLPLGSFGGGALDVSKEVHPCNVTPTLSCTRIVLNAVDARDIDPNSYYRFSFTALSPSGTTPSPPPASASQVCTIENLTVRAFSRSGASGDRIPISTRLILKSVGFFGRSQQALTAQAPFRAPASGLFNYVVFSELDLNVTK